MNGIVTVPRQNKFRMHNRRRQQQGGCSARFNGGELASTLGGGTRMSPSETGACLAPTTIAGVGLAAQGAAHFSGWAAAIPGISRNKQMSAQLRSAAILA